MDVTAIIRRFESPDEVREMTLGRFEVIHLGGLTVGRATYQPGWKWSSHVGPTVGATRVDGSSISDSSSLALRRQRSRTVA